MVEVNLASATIDLHTFTDLENKIYGDSDTAISYFKKEFPKVLWFQLIDILIRPSNSSPNFGTNVTYTISRSADLLMNLRFHVTLPKIKIKDDDGIYHNAYVRWSKNLLHNLFKKISFIIQDQPFEELTPEILDVNQQFNIPECKRKKYDEMIGNIGCLISDKKNKYDVVQHDGTLILDLPFWFNKKNANKYPIGSAPFSEHKLQVEIEDFYKLITIYPGEKTQNDLTGVRGATIRDIVDADTNSTPNINIELRSEYAILNPEEAIQLSSTSQDIVINVWEMLDPEPFNESNLKIKVNPKGSVKMVVACTKNVSLYKTCQGIFGDDKSNYNCQLFSKGENTLEKLALYYDNYIRISGPSEMFNYYIPNKRIPEIGNIETGFYSLIWALKPMDSDPSGSTNLSVIRIAELKCTPSKEILNAWKGETLTKDKIVYPNENGVLVEMKQQHELVLVALTTQIITINDGVARILFF